VTIEDDLAYLVGQTIPPPNTADFFLFSLDAVAQRKYGGGTGEPNDPYLIYTAEQMNAIGAEPNDWDKYFKLMADIDLEAYTGTDFNIIGTSYDNAFTGVFNGSGHTISNFSYISTDRGRVGLFRYVDGENALIKDLGLIDPNVDAGTGSYVGSLVDRLSNGTISNCYIESGSVSGGRYVGGLVGMSFRGTITGCYVDGSSVSGNDDVGGLVGYNYDGTITDCYASGSVSGNEYVGGLVGHNNRGTITNCTSSGSVSGNDDVGGLVGHNYDGTITDCYASGSASGNDDVGGLVGGNYGTISNCYAAGSVSSSGTEWLHSGVGGLVGYNNGTISDCSSAGSVSGTTNVGGLVGLNHYGIISNCYSSGDVSGDEDVGGLVGDKDHGSVTSSFWDIQTSGQATSVGGTGLTTAEMQDINTFLNAGWDFVRVWSICEGTNYPRLVWQIAAGDFVCPDGITIEDFVFFAEYWRDDNCDLSNDYCQGTDLDFSGTVDEADLEILVENWLAVGND
jgi:hypothetical protein